MTEALAANDEPGAATPRSGIAGRLGGQALFVLAGNLFTLAVGLPLQIFVSRKLGARAGFGHLQLAREGASGGDDGRSAWIGACIDCRALHSAISGARRVRCA